MKKRSAKKQSVSLPLVHPRVQPALISETTFMQSRYPKADTSPGFAFFSSMTSDLLSLAQWLKDCSIDTVAMESTGVYWKPLFEVLLQEGFEVYLVNSKQVRNVSGRKNDEDDAMWLQKLHSCGLLKSSFLPGVE